MSKSQTTLARFDGGPPHNEVKEIYGTPLIYEALEYIGISREQYLRGELPGLPVQTKRVEYMLETELPDGTLKYSLR